MNIGGDDAVGNLADRPSLAICLFGNLPRLGNGGGAYVDPVTDGGTSFPISSGALTNATSPDALEAQNIIMRRIALEGDVIGSRVPPPLNITQIGGYINLLNEI